MGSQILLSIGYQLVIVIELSLIDESQITLSYLMYVSSSFTYYYQSVIVNSFSLSQSDPIKCSSTFYYICLNVLG
jgi:hypothetical protein